MNEIKEIWSNFEGDLTPEENIPYKILVTQSEAINRFKDVNEVYSTVVTSTGDNMIDIKHVLYLLPIYGNGYNYRYIEFTQPFDSIYPVQIKAFQVGNNDFGIVNKGHGEKEIYTILEKIFNDKRTKIVLTQLKSMGSTMKDWRKK